jgi:hypothetical protein
MLAPLRKPPLARGFIHARIMAHARDGGVVDDLLGKMLASRAVGFGALPADLGLGEARLTALLALRFPRLPWILEGGGADAARLPERQDLIALLLRHAPREDERREAAQDMVLRPPLHEASAEQSSGGR